MESDEQGQARCHGNGSTRRPRSGISRRRPHSQPDRLLPGGSSSDSPRSKEDSPKATDSQEPLIKAPEEDKGMRVFKRRENTNRASAEDAGKKNATKVLIVKLKKKQSPEEKLPENKRRRQRMILEGSDEEDSEELSDKKNESTSRKEESNPKMAAKPPATEGVRKSSRVVKRRTFDDEIEYEEFSRRRKKPQDNKQVEMWVEENTDSADEEQPRKKPKRGSIQDLHFNEKPKRESVTPREKPLTARQRTKAGKEASSAQPSTSEVQQNAESPSDSVESKEKSLPPLTARQRSLQACKEGETKPGLIEFPDGLNNTDRRRRTKLTEEEKLAKKAEAASKRKQQVEKAAKEIQASAIQKILNQDSNRKKREEKIQKQKQEMAEGRKAAEQETATNTIRCIIGPSGTTLSWAQDAELPPLFSNAPISYPPPREKCAACDNTYKYRDSKSNLPLCSLQCYKAIRQPLQVDPAH